MNEQTQKVSIILSVHNAETTLAACLDSLLSQTYEDIEIIAIDDHSKDRSRAIIHTYARLDKRVKVSHNVKRYGMSITLNRALDQIKGRYIVFMNPNDSITKDKLRKQIQYLSENPTNVAVGTQSLYLNDQHKRIGKSYFPTETHIIHKTIFTGFAVQNESVLIDRFKLPKDLLHFAPVADKRFSYTHLFVKLLQYGEISNLDQQLYNHSKQHDILGLRFEIFSYIKLWLQARFIYDLQLPLQTLFYPIVR